MTDFGPALLTVLHISARALVWSLIGLGLLLALVILRLNAGPVQLDWLQPRIEQALTPGVGPIAVRAGRTELRLNLAERALELVGLDVRYQVETEGAAAARPFLIFPEVEISLSAEAFLKQGLIAASEITARAPSLILKRTEDGIIGLQSEEGYDGSPQAIDFRAFLHRFAMAPDEDQRLAFLKTLTIGGGRVAFYDRTRSTALTAKAADLVLTRQDEGVEGWLRADIVQKSAPPASVQISAEVTPGRDHVPFQADVAELMPADLPVLWPFDEPKVPPALAGMRLPVRASIAGDMSLDGTFSPLAVEIQTAAGSLDFPGHLAEPLDIGQATLAGTLSLQTSALEIDQALIESGGARLEGQGLIAWRPGDSRVAVELAATGLPVDDLGAFWPVGMGSPVRSWVVDNLETGQIRRADVRLDLQPEDFSGKPLRAAAIDGRFDFEGLSVRYVETMPPLEDARGRARFDGERIDFDVSGGQSAGITLNGGTVAISGIGRPGRLTTGLRVLADTEGPVAEALALLNAPPLTVADEIGIAPSASAGRVAAKLDISMPLYDGVTDEEALVLAEAEISDLAIQRLPKMAGDLRLDDGAFSLSLDDRAVRLDGSAAINGIPLAIDIYEPKDLDDEKRRIGFAGRLTREQLEGQGLAAEGVDGAVDLKATVTETDSQFWVDLEADLQAAALAPSGFAWQKPPGEPGQLRASIAIPLDGPVAVKQFDLVAGGLEATGALTLSPSKDGLQQLSVERFRLGETDGSFRLIPDGDGSYEIEIEAARLDLDALFEGDGMDDRFPRFHAALRADELRAKGIALADVVADVAHVEQGWRSASLIGTLPSGGKLAVELSPDGDARRLQVRSEDAGALFAALDLGQRIDGGDFLFSARITAEDPVVADGRLEIGDFVLEDAPLLARMLTLASLTGIGNLLGGEGIQVDDLILPFAVENGTITLKDGLMRGSQLGLTIKGQIDTTEETLSLAGTIIPVYSLNRLIGQVPLIGRILTGADGRGAFAATYGINGRRENPAVYVNPLSILTPGLLRDLVGGLVNGTLEPPEVRATDD